MKPANKKILPVMLAGLLQLMPFLRSALPALQFVGSPTGALVLRWVAGGVAFLGYHAISSASSISISPTIATVGTPYAGTVTYTGGHSGSVHSMKYTGTCLGSTTFAPGMTITYSSGHTATISGTPTTVNSNMAVTLSMYSANSCGAGDADTRSTTFTIQSAGAGLSAPVFTVAPQNLVSQVGADVLFSGGATGNPTPSYYWKQGLTVLPGATTNTLSLLAVTLTNGGTYSLIASNSQGQASAACDLSIVLTPGSNILAFDFTNYAVAGSPVTMSSYITNVPAAANSYSWQYNNVNIGVTTSNLSLTGAQAIPSKSGIYAVNFNSSVGTNVIVNNEAYYSYWGFGYLPGVTNQPAGGTVASGTNFTFNASIVGTAPTASWYRNGSNLIATQSFPNFTNNVATAATNVSLTLTNVTSANSGTYTVVVTNFWGTSTSSNAVLTVQSGSVPAPVLAGSVSGNQFVLSFATVPSQSYTVQYKTNLTNASWSQLTNFTAGGTNATATDGISNSSRYYRVSAP